MKPEYIQIELHQVSWTLVQELAVPPLLLKNTDPFGLLLFLQSKQLLFQIINRSFTTRGQHINKCYKLSFFFFKQTSQNLESVTQHVFPRAKS